MNLSEEGASNLGTLAGSASEHLIIFTRYPRAGQAKTRLIPVLGSEGAASLQRRLTLRAVRVAETLSRTRNVRIEIHFDGATRQVMEHWLGDRFNFYAQNQGDLGQRMLNAFDQSFRAGSKATVMVGADCPDLTESILNEAFDNLGEAPVVFGPATDGGYYLIGLRQPVARLFSGPVWGTSTVLADSLKIVAESGLEARLLRPLSDIDRPEDLAIWQQTDQRESRDLAQVSVIIPALNEAERIASTVAAAARGNPREIIVVDGGSGDDTVEQAQESGAVVIGSRPGRGRQMNAGASRAGGSVLLFIHADTLLPDGYVALIKRSLLEETTGAGAFSFALEETFCGSKLVEWTTNLRSRWGQMPYGDQGLFLRRALFETLGGFAELPILEDYEMVRRLREFGRVVTLPERVITSSRRWVRHGFVKTTLINKWMVLGYRLGWPVEKLAAAYRNCPR